MPTPEVRANRSPGRNVTTERAAGRASPDCGSASRPPRSPAAPGSSADWGRGDGSDASSRSGSVMSASTTASTIAPLDPAEGRPRDLPACDAVLIARPRRPKPRPEAATRGRADDVRGDPRFDFAPNSRSSSSVAPRRARSKSSTKRATRGSRFSLERGNLLVSTGAKAFPTTPRGHGKLGPPAAAGCAAELRFRSGEFVPARPRSAHRSPRACARRLRRARSAGAGPPPVAG